jgi:acylphosphatase
MESNNQPAVELHAIFRGRVQGVGFRITAREAADAYRLTGTVKNLPDGTVELIAQGPRQRLEAYLRHLQQLFQLTRENVVSEFRTVRTKWVDFQILR